MKKLAVQLFILLLTAQTLVANTYKVKSEEEFKTILPKIAPGDRIIIANGNYTNWSLEIPTTGTKAKPVVIMAETAGKVVFSGDVSQTLFKFTGAFTTLSGITFNACTLLKAKDANGLLVEFKNTSNCRLSDCGFTANVVKGQFMPLVIISGNGTSNKVDSCRFNANVDNQDVQVKITKDSCPQLTVIENNLFTNKNKVSWSNGNGGECIQIGQDPILLGTKEANTTVRFNKFIHCDGENEVISNKSSRNSYVKNYFEANDGELVMRGGHDCIISDNVFEGGTGGIRINGTGHTITNNKINNIKTAIRLMYGMAKGKEETGFYIAASNCTVTNNHISNATTGILVGDSKNADWTGKFDTKRYPSRVMQDVAPFDNKIAENTFVTTKNSVVTQ
jgi:poly(beta-D-mannuronate) lyase